MTCLLYRSLGRLHLQLFLFFFFFFLFADAAWHVRTHRTLSVFLEPSGAEKALETDATKCAEIGSVFSKTRSRSETTIDDDETAPQMQDDTGPECAEAEPGASGEEETAELVCEQASISSNKTTFYAQMIVVARYTFLSLVIVK